jgi:hypothetical protein
MTVECDPQRHLALDSNILYLEVTPLATPSGITQ